MNFETAGKFYDSFCAGLLTENLASLQQRLECRTILGISPVVNTRTPFYDCIQERLSQSPLWMFRLLSMKSEHGRSERIGCGRYGLAS